LNIVAFFLTHLPLRKTLLEGVAAKGCRTTNDRSASIF
jgi:hypothetical protein